MGTRISAIVLALALSVGTLAQLDTCTWGQLSASLVGGVRNSLILNPSITKESFTNMLNKRIKTAKRTHDTRCPSSIHQVPVYVEPEVVEDPEIRDVIVSDFFDPKGAYWTWALSVQP